MISICRTVYLSKRILTQLQSLVSINTSLDAPQFFWNGRNSLNLNKRHKILLRRLHVVYAEWLSCSSRHFRLRYLLKCTWTTLAYRRSNCAYFWLGNFESWSFWRAKSARQTIDQPKMASSIQSSKSTSSQWTTIYNYNKLHCTGVIQILIWQIFI